jgi:small subunit ribosomal protein S8
MYSDPIADMFTRIRNGYMAKQKTVSMPASKMKIAIAELLAQMHYIKAHEVKDEGSHKSLHVQLSYYKGKPAITKIKRVSKAGRRIYRSSTDLPYVLSGLGIAIISTSEGVMTAKQANKKGLGGEVVGEVY